MGKSIQIKSFSIEALNDLYDYKDCSIPQKTTDLLILYGDNGSGKTSILNLLFHLMSSVPNKGHLNAISRIPFKSIEVRLTDDTVVSAKRSHDANSLPILFQVISKKKSTKYNFIPESIRERSVVELLENHLKQDLTLKKSGKTFQLNYLNPAQDRESYQEYIKALQDLNIVPYYMATDRRIRCDLLDEKRSSHRQVIDSETSDDDVISRTRSQYLKDALNSAARYINRQIIRATNTGSRNTNDIYADLINKIAKENVSKKPSEAELGMQKAIDQLNFLAKENKRFSNLGLTPSLEFDEIVAAIKDATPQSKVVLNKIVTPYIDSLNARHSALLPVGEVTETFLGLLNQLFRHKSVNFSPSDGFNVYGHKNRSAPLATDKLSSGEQQLLLMFCYLLISKETPSIFMIDEPEISLNVKWQRELIDAMQEIAKDSNVQLLIATHSIELLAEHSEHVIALNPKITNENNLNYELTDSDVE